MNNKGFICIFFFLLILFITFIPQADAEMNPNDIPKDAIRLRILANSDSPEGVASGKCGFTTLRKFPH